MTGALSTAKSVNKLEQFSIGMLRYFFKLVTFFKSSDNIFILYYYIFTILLYYGLYTYIYILTLKDNLCQIFPDIRASTWLDTVLATEAA